MSHQHQVELQLPLLHPAQDRVVREAKRFNVLCCGRRWGKTVLGMDRLIRTALLGQPVAWFSPTNKVMADTWRILKRILKPVTQDKNEQEKRLTLTGGGVIELWSLDNPDSGRGRKYKLAVIDEACMVRELRDAWQQSIRPTLTDLEGEAWFLSTPHGMDYFKTLYDLGQDPQRGDWASWQMPTTSNPYIKPEEVESARLDMMESAFNQEYSALFVNWEGSVFRKVTDAATATPRETPEAGHEYVIGCDWGRSNDYTVLLVLDVTTRTVVKMDRSNRVDYAVQCERLRVLSDQWRPKRIIAEQNSAGQPVIEQLVRDGLRIEPFTTTNTSKQLAIEALALAFERQQITIVKDPVLESELVAFKAERLPSGQTRYSAPSGQHDDTVMALAMAWTAVCEQHSLVFPIPDTITTQKQIMIPEHWPRAYALDVRNNSAAIVWGAHDPESDVVYLYSEHVGEADSAIVASVVRRHGDWIPGLIDPTGNGRDVADGQRLARMYRKEGMHLATVENPLQSGILDMGERMRSGRLQVFPSLSKYLEEIRTYRRDERGNVIRERDSLQDAARCLVLNFGRMIKKPVPNPYIPPSRPRGWMA